LCWTNSKIAICALYLKAVFQDGSQVGSACQKHDIFSRLCQSAAEVTPDAACPDNSYTHMLLLRNCAAATEVGASPLFSRSSCSARLSRVEEKTSN
jgi:hypothetical protein